MQFYQNGDFRTILRRDSKPEMTASGDRRLIVFRFWQVEEFSFCPVQRRGNEPKVLNRRFEADEFIDDPPLSEDDEGIFDQRVDLVQIGIRVGVGEGRHECEGNIPHVKFGTELVELFSPSFFAVVFGIPVNKIDLQEFSAPDAFLFEKGDPGTNLDPVRFVADKIQHALESTISADGTRCRAFVRPECVIWPERGLVVADI